MNMAEWIFHTQMTGSRDKKRREKSISYRGDIEGERNSDLPRCELLTFSDIVYEAI